MTLNMAKYPVEDDESWLLHLNRQQAVEDAVEEQTPSTGHRRLKHHRKHHRNEKSPHEVEKQAEKAFWEAQQEAEEKEQKKRKKKLKKRRKKINKLYRDPGIQQSTEHGMMIDAGSTGSRLHLYEWDPRVLRDSKDVQEAVSGRKISFPGTESRWTERLRPGLSEFAQYEGRELESRLEEYLKPLIKFAKTILHEKEDEFKNFPIYLRATAGMRILESEERAKVINAVRKLFKNETYCPFYFEDEQARVLSGEEEAIYDWAGVNFLMGNLVEESKGSGTVLNPKKTYGALDLGGGSTQIAFYEPNEDIMADIFKVRLE
jgi:Golgi nucleoside diphosphatase